MRNPTSGNEASQILRFWHQVEFFIPFDLAQVHDVPDAEWAVRAWSDADLRQDALALWSPPLPEGRRLTGFDVYIGVFDKRMLAEVTEAVVREALPPDERARQEQDERGALEGPTCFARLKVGPAGEPVLDEVSVSTAPWALGRIQNAPGNLAALDVDAFRAAVEDLKISLRQFRATHARPEDAAAPSAQAVPLSGGELLGLADMFEAWAGFHPERGNGEAARIVVRAKSAEDKGSQRSAASDPVNGQLPLDAADPDGEDGAGADIEVDILNSFFAKDIERAIVCAERGRPGAALGAYLTPLAADRRLDLYSRPGREAMLAALAPRRLPAAHWPDVPAHAMSLMQQFAINSLLERLEEGGIFSVNGPPGTGKTTLLRDVFAELITRRARVLAGFSQARDALADGVSVEFHGEQPCRVRPLHEALTGFEMVVCSSNNAAVENLSRDLPKAKALGAAGKTPWRDRDGAPTLGYLAAVAHNVAARTAKGDYAKLGPDDAPWGLIACALGKKSNRSAFAFRLKADARKSAWPVKGFDPDKHQSLWTWREKYRGPDFAAARAAFAAADDAVERRIAMLDRYAVLAAQLQGLTRDGFCALHARAAEAARQACDSADGALAAIEQERELSALQLALLREAAGLIALDQPRWWLRWLYRDRARRCAEALAGNRREQLEWLTRQRAAETGRRDAQQAAGRARAALAAAARALAERQGEWDALQREWDALRNALRDRLPHMVCPADADALDDARWQIEGLWHDETTNALRSALFAAALGLQQAWLAEVLQPGGGFGANIVALDHLLSGKRLLQPEHALAVWQSLFMVVPVISSTFASVASQFRDLGQESLGWLFIDEAGQAVPQAAVGALWRARRAVVVGDPLQIEPVFTVPIALTAALARAARLPEERQVAPHLASVQNLADEANALGAWSAGPETRQWIGSPLRVHRRCVDPMFTIANQIAYGGKMIFFDQHDPALRMPPPDSLDLGPSAWVDIGGETSGKQVVPAQIDLVARAVAELHRRTGALPALYVISPFRRVRDALIDRLSAPQAWPAERRPSRTALREWCKAHIGTVHTFQGKEESLVWMVLGCDAGTRGAAAWAAGKPNLLNVALTRAKHRFFIVGDAGLWSGLPHFADAGPAVLPRIPPAAFLQRVREGMPAGAGAAMPAQAADSGRPA